MGTKRAGWDWKGGGATKNSEEKDSEKGMKEKRGRWRRDLVVRRQMEGGDWSSPSLRTAVL